MKRNFNCMNNQKGFVFPFIVITVMILFLVLLTIISRFKHEVTMTENIQDHYIFESLFALAEHHKETSFSSENDLPDPKIYQFPQGDVAITYTSAHTQFTIQYTMTLNNGKEYSVYQSYHWENILDNDPIHD